MGESSGFLSRLMDTAAHANAVKAAAQALHSDHPADRPAHPALQEVEDLTLSVAAWAFPTSSAVTSQAFGVGGRDGGNDTGPGQAAAPAMPTSIAAGYAGPVCT